VTFSGVNVKPIFIGYSNFSLLVEKLGCKPDFETKAVYCSVYNSGQPENRGYFDTIL